MADPFSIATGVFALLHVAGKVATELNKLHENAASVHSAIKELQSEIHGLQTVLESMRTVCEHITAERGSGHIGSLWDGVAQAVVDGKQGLEQFLEVMEEINKETKFLDDYRKQLRLTKSEEKIARCRTHVQACSQTLQVCLLAIGLVNQNAHLSIAEIQVLPSLAELQEDVRRIAHRLDHAIKDPQPTVPTKQDKDHQASMKNLLGCVRSAASVISDTATNRSAEPDSSVKRLQSNATSYILRHKSPTLKRWIESRTVYYGEDGEQFRAVAAPLSVADVPTLGESDEDEDSDTEFQDELTWLLFNNGKQKLVAGDYEGAEKLLNSSLERTKTSRIENQRGAQMQVEILGTLYTMYLDQQRLPQAKEILRQKMTTRQRGVSTLSLEYLSDVVSLAELSMQLDDIATAQLNARKALVGYRKLKSPVEMRSCLNLLITLCQADGSESDLAAYEIMLEHLIITNPDSGTNASSEGMSRKVKEEHSPPSHLHQSAAPSTGEIMEEAHDGASRSGHLSDSELSYTTTAFEGPTSSVPDMIPADDTHTEEEKFDKDDRHDIYESEPGEAKLDRSEADESHTDGGDFEDGQFDDHDTRSWAGSDNAESTLVSENAEPAPSSLQTSPFEAQQLAGAPITTIGLQRPPESLNRPASLTFDLSQFDKDPKDEIPLPFLHGRQLRRIYAEEALHVEKEAVHVALPAIVTHREMFTTPELDDLALRMQEPHLYGLRFRRTYAEEELNVGKEVLHTRDSPRSGAQIYAEQEESVEKECVGLVPSISLDGSPEESNSKPSAGDLAADPPSVRSALLTLLQPGPGARVVGPLKMPSGISEIALSPRRDGMNKDKAFNSDIDVPSPPSEVLTSIHKLRTSMSGLDKRLGLDVLSRSVTEAGSVASPDLGDSVSKQFDGEKTTSPLVRSSLSSPGAALRKRRPSIRRKLVIVGDSTTGKTRLAKSYAYGSAPVDSGPTVSESYTVDVEVDGEQVELALWDTGGRTEYDHLRPISYSGAHAVLLCFAIDDPDSLDNVAAKWSPDAQSSGRHIPMILVGTKVDLRWDQATGARLQRLQQFPVSRHQGEQLQRRIGALEYIECSTATGEGVQMVFEHSIRAAASFGKDRRRRNLLRIF